MNLSALETLLAQAERLLMRLEAVLPHPLAAPDWGASIAFRYRKRAGSGWLEPVRHVAPSACPT
jgi:predicted AAA+ superfamily ATPase